MSRIQDLQPPLPLPLKQNAASPGIYLTVPKELLSIKTYRNLQRELCKLSNYCNECRHFNSSNNILQQLPDLTLILVQSNAKKNVVSVNSVQSLVIAQNLAAGHELWL